MCFFQYYLNNFSYALFHTNEFFALSYQKTDGVKSSNSKFLITSISQALLYAIAELVVHKSIQICIVDICVLVKK